MYLKSNKGQFCVKEAILSKDYLLAAGLPGSATLQVSVMDSPLITLSISF